MNNIDVYLTVNMRDHPLYRELIKYPPKDVEYHQLGSAPPLSETLCNKFRGGLNILTKLRYGLYPSNKCDLIHSSQTLVLNRKPWVVDFEHVSAFTKFKQKKLETHSIKESLEKALTSKYCKKIMPHSVFAEKSLINVVDSRKFKNKIEVVYPAIAAPPMLDHEKEDNIQILFVGKKFVRKGGIEALMAFENLNRKYKNIEIVVVSNVPEKIRSKYQQYRNIKAFSNVPDDTLTQLYAQSDIFLFPTHFDTFGVVFIEAMAHSLPIVSIDGGATSEIIENGKNGFLVKPHPTVWYDEKCAKRYEWDQLEMQLKKKDRERIARDLVEKLSLLIEDEKLRKKMGRYGRKQIENGYFSINERNKKLKRIYEESLKA